MRRFNIGEGGKLLDRAQLRRGVVRKDEGEEGESRPGVLKVRLIVYEVQWPRLISMFDLQRPSLLHLFSWTSKA